MRARFTDYCVEFGNDHGGFPTKILQYLRNGRVSEIVHTDAPWLTVKLADGRLAVPTVDEDHAPLVRHEDDGSIFMQYSGIGFRADGEMLDGWRLNMEYELIPDGNVFIDMSFQASAPEKPDVTAFTLRIPMDFGDETDVIYSYWPRPNVVDPTAISAVGDFVRGRGLHDHENRCLPFISPNFSFDFGRPQRPARHIEWMLEEQTGLDDHPYHAETRLTWVGGSPILEYEFATEPVKATAYPYYWHNQMNFFLGQTPKRRDKAPQRFYHCIDAFERIPTVDRVRQMAAEGCDMLALHDACWRTDIRNGGNPEDEKAFIDMIEECHRHDIHVTPYFRGSEECARENACDWFKYYLKPNYDGLYSDYGAAFSFHEVNDRYPAGRIAFRQHYKHYKRIHEETIGKDGLLTVHTGPFLSGCVIGALVDGYVSGEGERGVMLRSRWQNAYYSAVTVAPPALWTAEFPDYRTYKMLPFMANIGQFPHAILGEQRKSASYAHPLEPGNVTFARPLWKLYGLMKDERQLKFDNDLCDETIVCDSYDTGLSRFAMQDGSILYLMSNFADRERRCSSNITLEAAKGQRIYRLHVRYEGCHAEALENGAAAEAVLPASGICGFLICNVNEKWTDRLELFRRPYPELFPAAKAYEERVQWGYEQRFVTHPQKTIYMKVETPYYPGNLEVPFFTESYQTTNRLYATDARGNRKLLGYLSKLGLTPEDPPKSACMWQGESSDWIPLHEYLEPGKYRMEVHTTLGDFDSSVRYHILLSENKDPENARDVTFYLALNDPKSHLTFDVEKGC